MENSKQKPSAPKPLANRIPSSELGECQPWQLPEIDARGNIVASVEKQARDRRASEDGSGENSGELIEDVDGHPPIKPLTAEMLKEIADAAEQEGRERGYREGLDEGREAGRAQALAEKRPLLEQQQKRLAQVAGALFQPMHEQDSAIESLMVEMICTLSRHIVRRELITDSGHILQIVREALAALPVGAKNLQVFLNPDDLALVETFAEEQQKDWRFIGDADLLPGGCRLETRESLVDYTVERRMQLLLEQFLDKQLDNGNNGAIDNETPMIANKTATSTAIDNETPMITNKTVTSTAIDSETDMNVNKTVTNAAIDNKTVHSNNSHER